MEIIVSHETVAGSVKQINQDSLLIKMIHSPKGKFLLSVVCDGVGGLVQGELASKEVITELNEWFCPKQVQALAGKIIPDEMLYDMWKKRIDGINQKLQSYARKHHVMLGTTLTMLLVCQKRYYVFHIGDSRLYQIGQTVRRLTEDHTLVEQEVRKGVITKEQAARDPRRNILWQCIGSSDVLEPQFVSGILTEDTTFLLCSDGFWNLITEKEMYNYFKPDCLTEKEEMNRLCKRLTGVAMNRGERDNITVIGIAFKDVI